jgi:hypothetical protein
MTMMEFPMGRIRIGPNPRMGRETSSRRETETKAETEMETETRIQEISSAIRTHSVEETAGTINRSDRTEQAWAAEFVIQQAPREMDREVENAKQERRSDLLSS